MFYIIIEQGACALKEIQRQTGLANSEYDLVSVGELNWGTQSNPQIADGYMKVTYKPHDEYHGCNV
jgi:hypothetical protein